MLSRAALRTARAAGSAKPAFQGAKVAFSFAADQHLVRQRLTSFQRSASSAATAQASNASRRNITLQASAATAVAVGSIAWYYHLYGRELHAMTPAEEGYVRTPQEEAMGRI